MCSSDERVHVSIAGPVWCEIDQEEFGTPTTSTIEM